MDGGLVVTNKRTTHTSAVRTYTPSVNYGDCQIGGKEVTSANSERGGEIGATPKRIKCTADGARFGFNFEVNALV